MENQQVKKTLDAQSLVKTALGADARISSVLPDGRAKVITTDPATGAELEKEFDIPGMLKSKNIDPASLSIKYNDEMSPVDENALSFTDRIKMNFASSTKQQAALLQTQFGKENVKADPNDDSQFVVKDSQGVWKKANTSFLSDVVGDLPEMAGGVAGSIAGAKAGALAGTAVAGPLGTGVGGVLGAIVGGGIGTFVAKAGEIKTAEALGIRTPEDLETLGGELGKEAAKDMIWSSVTAGAGSIAKNTVGRIANKETLSNLFGSLIKGTKADDWMAVMRSSDSAKQIKGLVESEAAWLSKKASGGYTALEETLSPVTKKTNDTMLSAISDFKKSAEVNFERGMKQLSDSGMLNAAKIDINDTFKAYGAKLVDLGLAEQSEGSFKLLGKQAIAEGKDLVGTQEGRKQLQSMFIKMEKIASSNGGKLSNFDDFIGLKRTIQTIENNAGVFGSAQMNPQVKSAMNTLGSGLINSARLQLNDVGTLILKDGNKVGAGDFMNKINKDYFTFKHYNDALGDAISKTGSTQDLLKLGQSLAEGKKMDLVDSFAQMGKASGSTKAAQYLDSLVSLKAAKNLSSAYSGDGITGVARQLAGLSPRAVTGKVAVGTNVASAAGDAAKGVSKYMGLANVNALVKQLSPTEMSQILTNKQLLDTLLNPITSYSDTKQSVEGALAGQLNGQQ